MARRDYNHDGKVDWYDELIEQDIFYGDDEELESHFRSLHNSLKRPRNRSSSRYSSPRSASPQNIDKQKVFADFEYKPSWAVIILFGIGSAFMPPLSFLALAGEFSFLVSIAIGMVIANCILKMQAENKDIEDKEKYGYVEFLEKNYPYDEAQKKIKEFYARQSKNTNRWFIFGVVFFIVIVIAIVGLCILAGSI